MVVKLERELPREPRHLDVTGARDRFVANRPLDSRCPLPISDPRTSVGDQFLSRGNGIDFQITRRGGYSQTPHRARAVGGRLCDLPVKAEAICRALKEKKSFVSA